MLQQLQTSTPETSESSFNINSIEVSETSRSSSRVAINNFKQQKGLIKSRLHEAICMIISL